MSRLVTLILALVAAVFIFIACGDDNNAQDTTTSLLSRYAHIGTDQNTPLIDKSCWDWYPEGDGVFWAHSGPSGGAMLTFNFKQVKKGSAVIDQLGPIKEGDVIFAMTPDGVIKPILKIIEINPAMGGVYVAPTGNITGGCKMSSPRTGA